MPNKRAKNQKLIALAIDQGLLADVDTARAVEGKDRSTFIRDAIVSALNDHGYSVPQAMAYAPDRAGKAKTVRYPAEQSQSMRAADEPSKPRSKAQAKKKTGK